MKSAGSCAFKALRNGWRLSRYEEFRKDAQPPGKNIVERENTGDFMMRITVNTTLFNVDNNSPRGKVINTMTVQEGNACGIHALNAVLRAFVDTDRMWIDALFEAAKQTPSTTGKGPITFAGEIPAATDIVLLAHQFSPPLGITVEHIDLRTGANRLVELLKEGHILMVPFYVIPAGPTKGKVMPGVLPKAMPRWCVVWAFYGKKLLVSHSWKSAPYVFDLDELVRSCCSIQDIPEDSETAMRLKAQAVQKLMEKAPATPEQKAEEELSPIITEKIKTATHLAGWVVAFKPAA
jgi:hypothetical protein